MECALCSCPSAREHSAQPRCFMHIISKEILGNKSNSRMKPETQKPVGWHSAVSHGNRAHFIERAFHSAVLAVLIIPQSVWDEYILGDGEIDEGRGLFYLVTYLFGCAWSYLRNPGSLMFLAPWEFFSSRMRNVLVLVYRIFSCGMWTITCGVWGLVPWSGVEPRPPAFGAQILSYLATGPLGNSLGVV